MTDDRIARLEKAREEVLMKQRTCGWCGHRAQTAEGLVRHILENHRPDGLKTVERELLAKLQQENAK